MNKRKKLLTKLGVAAACVVFITIVMLTVNYVGYNANMKVATGIESVEIRQLALELDDLGYWTFTMEEDSSFRILQLTDIHIGNGFLSFTTDSKAMNAVKELVNHAKPDLIIVSGDMVYPVPIQAGTGNNYRASKLFGEFMNNFGIPWTITFGNHDDEWYSWYRLDTIAEIYEGFDNCLFQRGPDDVYGYSNYMINVLNYDGTLNTTLVMFDSNSYAGWRLFEYDKIHDCQIEWYERELTRVSNHYELDNLVPSLAFFHIPLNEFEDAWQLYRQGSDEVIYHFGDAGEDDEKVYAPKYRGNLFDKMVELDSTKGVFVGHDHLNNFSITYQGIRLTYAMSIDYLAYLLSYRGFADMSEQRGGTIIEINSDSSFEVEHLPLNDVLNS